MRDLHLQTPAVGERISQRYLKRLEKSAANVPAMSEGTVGRWLSAVVHSPGVDSFKIYTCTLTADLLPGSSAGATLLIGALKNETGSVITVYDVPTAITAAKKIASGTKCRVFKDHDMDLADDEYVLLIPFACEVAQ